MTRITDMSSDLQAEALGHLSSDHLQGGGRIMWRPHYWPHSLFETTSNAVQMLILQNVE